MLVSGGGFDGGECDECDTVVDISVAVIVVMPCQFNSTVLRHEPGAKGYKCRSRLESGCSSRGRGRGRTRKDFFSHSHVLQTGVVTAAAKRCHGVQALWMWSAGLQGFHAIREKTAGRSGHGCQPCVAGTGAAAV